MSLASCPIQDVCSQRTHKNLHCFLVKIFLIANIFCGIPHQQERSFHFFVLQRKIQLFYWKKKKLIICNNSLNCMNILKINIFELLNDRHDQWFAARIFLNYLGLLASMPSAIHLPINRNLTKLKPPVWRTPRFPLPAKHLFSSCRITGVSVSSSFPQTYSWM